MERRGTRFEDKPYMIEAIKGMSYVDMIDVVRQHDGEEAAARYAAQLFKFYGQPNVSAYCGAKLSDRKRYAQLIPELNEEI